MTNAGEADEVCEFEVPWVPMADFANECEEQNWIPNDCELPEDDHHSQSTGGQA
jgi:hypothetical protein